MINEHSGPLDLTEDDSIRTVEPELQIEDEVQENVLRHRYIKDFEGQEDLK